MEKQQLVEYFEEVETIQEYNGYFCSIPEAISIVVLGSICGLRNISQMHQWAGSEKVAEFLKEKFGIEHIPCYYWLPSLLKLLKPESLNKCLMKWAETMLPENRKGLTISQDGKTTRSTGKKDYVQDESLRKTMDCKSITEKSQDRIEKRTAYTTADIDWLYGKEKRDRHQAGKAGRSCQGRIFI